MRPLFIDSGAFIAIANRGDQFEKEAEEAWGELEENQRPLISSDHVLDEVATAICRCHSPRRAAEWVRQQLDTGLIHWIQPTGEDLRLATGWLEKYSDQKVNFTDAVSFVLMRRERIEDVFTFDRHFHLAGFQQWPSR